MGTAYEVVAYALRYWFIFVTLAILIAVIYISYKEYKEKQFVLGEIGRYGGYLEIVGGPAEFLGDRFGLTDENTIGSSKKSDIMIPDETILKAHALIYRQDGELFLSPLDKAATMINGRRATTAHKLKTGDTLSFGDVDMRIYIKRTRISDDH
ncbi:MAG: FHA domain-containing protein [Christensenellaceae bacterium]